MLGFGKRALRLNLALQGGGAHGAFTWGVIDRLLDEPDLEIGWISGTSAGAVNAVALAHGLVAGGRAGARDSLRAVWEAVQEAGLPDLLRFNPFLLGISRSQALGQMASMFSPYEFNPLGFDPLRKLLLAHIDFERLRQPSAVELIIAATDVATARRRLFRRSEISVEAVLASACLPTLHHAVEIQGRAYWDGGFTANPELLTLALESPVRDTLLVLLNPIERSVPARSARDIAAAVNRVTFSAPLLRDITEIVALQRDRVGFGGRRSRAGCIQAHHFHMVEGGRHTGALAAETKMRPDKAIVGMLFNAGREEARRWLGRHRKDVGRRNSIDFAAHFLASTGPLAAAPSDAGEDHEVAL